MTERVSAASHSQLGRIARGGALNLVGSVVSAVSSFLLVVAVANYFDENTAGMLFAATSLFVILEALTGLGTDTGLARFLLRCEAQGRYGDVATVIRSALTPVAAISIGCAVYQAAMLIVGHLVHSVASTMEGGGRM